MQRKKLILNKRKISLRCFTIYCKKCGEELADNQKFCTKCGTPVNGQKDEDVEAKTEEKIETVVQSFEKDPQLQDHWIKRLIAYIIDAVITNVVAGILLIIALFPFFISNPFGFFNIYSYPFWSGVVAVVYFTILESSRGASFGKSLIELKVVTKDGGAVTLEKAFIRNVSKLYPVLLLLDLIAGVVTSTDLHQKYGDRIANTTVE